jgi:hypothetical protein
MTRVNQDAIAVEQDGGAEDVELHNFGIVERQWVRFGRILPSSSDVAAVGDAGRGGLDVSEDAATTVAVCCRDG